MTSNLPSTRLEVNATVQTVTSIPAVDSTTQSVRVEEPTLESGITPTIDNSSLVFSSQPHNTIRYERADSRFKISQKSTRLHVLQVIANLNSVYPSYHHGKVIHPDFVQKFVDNLQLHHMGALRASWIDSKEWKRDFFISQLQALHPQNPDAIDKIFLQAIKDWRLLYNCMDETVVAKSSDLLLEIHHQYDKRGGWRGQSSETTARQYPYNRQDQLDYWFLKAQSACSVTLPLQSIVDFQFVLMITF